MDLQKQQTGLSSTTNPQAIPQVPLSAGTSNLQQNTGSNTANLSQLQSTSLTVTNSCTANCSGSVQAATTTTSAGSTANMVWLVAALVIVVSAGIAWSLRRAAKNDA